MNKTIYVKEGCVKINYKPETGVIYIFWKNMFDQNTIRECSKKVLQEVRNGAKVIVLDISKTKGVVLEETQKWVETYIFPGHAEAGLKAIVTIDSEIPVTQLSSRRWTELGSKFSFDMVTVSSKEEAAKVVMNYL